MADFNARSDSINVEQIMEQIRGRIREKRGVDYTEQQIRELAAVKLETFLDPRGVRSDLLEEFRRRQVAGAPVAPPNYVFGDETLFETHRGPLRLIRRLLQPLLKLFFNPNPLIQALHIQSELNTINVERETTRRGLDQLHFEVLHNLVIETTRMSIELKNLRMQLESLTGRLEFNERRARALESVVACRPSSTPAPNERAASERREPGPSAPIPATAETATAPREALSPSGISGVPSEGPGQRSRRRRRRRGRRGGGSAASIMGAPGGQDASAPSTPSPDSIQDPMGVEAQRAEPAESQAPTESPTRPADLSSTGSGPSDDQ
jgi:hypothetical protein